MKVNVHVITMMNILLISLNYTNAAAITSYTNPSIPLIRLGTKYGGWTVPYRLLSCESICYCAGAGEDISFDCQLAERYGCIVNIFDPTPRAIKHFQYLKEKILNDQKAQINNTAEEYKISKKNLYKLNFYPLGLWDSDIVMKFFFPQNSAHVSCSITNLQKTDQFFEAPCKKLSTIMKELGHEKIDLLKLDIEGAEYTVIDTIINDQLYTKILCICLEFDEFAGNNLANNTDLEGSLKKVNQYISKLKSCGYEIVHQHGYTDLTFIKKDIIPLLIN